MQEELSAITLEEVRRILNEATATGNPSHGGAGRFWNAPIAEWGQIYGIQAIIVGDPDNSGIIKALRGEPPFDGSLFQRMPQGLPPVSEANINLIAQFIRELPRA
jgi:hypothetical protein